MRLTASPHYVTKGGAMHFGPYTLPNTKCVIIISSGNVSSVSNSFLLQIHIAHTITSIPVEAFEKGKLRGKVVILYPNDSLFSIKPIQMSIKPKQMMGQSQNLSPEIENNKNVLLI